LFGHRSSPVAHPSLTPAFVVCPGFDYVRCRQFSQLADDRRWGARDNLAAVATLDLIEPGNVLVIGAQGYAKTLVLGDSRAQIAKLRGATDVVTVGRALGSLRSGQFARRPIRSRRARLSYTAKLTTARL